MIWYRRSRMFATTWLVSLVSVAIALVASEVVIPLPNLVSVLFVPVALSLLLPLAPVVSFGYGLARAQTSLDRAAVRPIAFYDLVAAGALVVFAGVLVCAIGDTRWSLGGAFLRNLVGFIGLLLVAIPVLGTRLAGLAPVAAVLASAMFGTGPNQMARWWAWPIGAPDSTSAAVGALVTVLVGVLAYASTANRVRGWRCSEMSDLGV